jgi:hypothetical protein
MGRWKIEIKGHGIHHNGREDDADTMAEKFVAELKAKGHDIEEASIELLGSNTSLMPPEVK